MNNLNPKTIDFSERRDLKSGLEFFLRTYRGKHRILDKEIVNLTKSFQGFHKLTTVGEAKAFLQQLPTLLTNFNEKCDVALREEGEVVDVCKHRADHLHHICAAYDASVLRNKKPTLNEVMPVAPNDDDDDNGTQRQRKRVTFADDPEEKSSEEEATEPRSSSTVPDEPMSVDVTSVEEQRPPAPLHMVYSDSNLLRDNQEDRRLQIKKAKSSLDDMCVPTSNAPGGESTPSPYEDAWDSVCPKVVRAMKRGHSLHTHTLAHQRANKLLMDHLISVGYYSTAVEVAKAVPGLWQLSLVQLCHEARNIEMGLRRGDLTPLNVWMQEVQFKLKAMDCSDFEFDLAIFQLYLLIQRGDPMAAIKMARETILPKLTDPHDLHVRTFREVMSLLVVRDPESFASVPLQNVGEERICQQFRALMRRVYGFSYPTTFALAVQLGLSNLKLPDCFDERRRKKHCLVCYPKSVNVLSRHLPFMRHYNSRLYCWYTGKYMDEHNRPMLLPSGYVYSKQAVDMLTNKNNEVRCPRSDRTFSRSDVLELYVI